MADQNDLKRFTKLWRSGEIDRISRNGVVLADFYAHSAWAGYQAALSSSQQVRENALEEAAQVCDRWAIPDGIADNEPYINMAHRIRALKSQSTTPAPEQPKCAHPDGCTFCAWCGFRSQTSSVAMTDVLPGKYRKKPVVIDAVQFTEDMLKAHLFDGKPLPEGLRCIQSTSHPARREIYGATCGIETLEGFMTANYGDWIITGVNGERYPCKPDIFEKTYEPALQSSPTASSTAQESSKQGELPPAYGFLCDWGNSSYGLTRQVFYYVEPGSASLDDWNESPKVHKNLPLYTADQMREYALACISASLPSPAPQTGEQFNSEVLFRVTTYLSQFDEFQPEGDDSAAQSAKNIIDCIDRLRAAPQGTAQEAAAPAVPSAEIKQLMDFYAAISIEDLAMQQARHIERLQSSLDAGTAGAPTKPRFA